MTSRERKCYAGISCDRFGQGPLANERLHLLADGRVTVEFKRPWSDGTRSIGLAPKALLSRMAALVPPPKRAACDGLFGRVGFE